MGCVCMFILRGGEEEQTPRASDCRLRPWRQGLAALTEVATNSVVQMPIHTHTPHTHTPSNSCGKEQEEEKRNKGKTGMIFGHSLMLFFFFFSTNIFSDQDVFICTDQNHAEVI